MGRRAIIMDLDGALCAGNAAAIRSANEHGFQTVLAASEPTEDAVETIRELLAREGARLDAIYTRQAGWFDRARNEMGIDLTASYMVGDRHGAVEDGRSAGATSVLVLAEPGKDELRTIRPDHVASDLASAVTWILEREASR